MTTRIELCAAGSRCASRRRRATVGIRRACDRARTVGAGAGAGTASTTGAGSGVPKALMLSRVRPSLDESGAGAGSWLAVAAGANPAVSVVKRQVRKVARTRDLVIIMGLSSETGLSSNKPPPRLQAC